MLDYFFFLFCFLSVFKIQIKGFDDFFSDYMNLSNTSSIKGIFVWLIIFHHKSDYRNYNNCIYKKITGNLGTKLVSMFLYYSGFGIYESLKSKGSNYPNSLLIKAFILFLKFQIIILMFLLTNIFVLQKKILLKEYLLSTIFRASLGNSNWFAFTIIILYCYSFLSFRFIKNKIYLGIIIISFICILHIKFIYKYYYPNLNMAVDNILCFIIGFYFSFMKRNLDKIIMKNDICYFFSISIIIFIYYKTILIRNLIYDSISNALFAIIIVFISMKVKFNNDFLLFLNSHSYSIYLLQRIVMIITYKKKIFNNSEFIQVSFEFSSIFFIASLFDKCTKFLDILFKILNGYSKKVNYMAINNKSLNKFIDINVSEK